MHWKLLCRRERQESQSLRKRHFVSKNQVDMIEKACRAGHIHRLNNNICYPEAGIGVFGFIQ